MWMFCSKAENIEVEVATFEDLLERDESRAIHKNKIHALLLTLIKIYNLIHTFNPLTMRKFFDLKQISIPFAVIIY